MTSLGETAAGAHRESWQKDFYRVLLKRVVEENPGKTWAEWRGLFRDEVLEEENADFHRSALNYAAHNGLIAMFEVVAPKKTGPRRLSDNEKAEREGEVKRAAQLIDAKLNERVKIRLLELVLESDKTVRDSTREELIAHGGWALRVAEKLQPGQTVGDAGLTEADLRVLYEPEGK
jgi:hypothetical protein